VLDPSTLRLGKQAPRHDSRTLRLARLVADLGPPPEELDRLTAIAPAPVFDLYGNNERGNCTCASFGHGRHFWTAANGNPRPPTQADIDRWYREACGWDPADPSTDRGGIMLLVANYFRKQGLIDAFVALDPKNESHLKHAVNLFGGAYVGVDLPLSAQKQERWRLAPGGTMGDPTPGSWGGHAIWALPKYDASGIWCVTWGGLKFMTWAWWQVHNDEAFAFLSREWADGDGAPNGKVFDQLREDLARVSA
jgi:hypothetical protein